MFGTTVVADTTSGYRVLETSHPPSYYLPPADCSTNLFTPTATLTVCEWKGPATYWTVAADGRETVDGAWSYPHPTIRFEPIAGYFAFHPAPFECFVDEQRVTPQAGRFYGGWVTPDVVGPFKGEPGTQYW